MKLQLICWGINASLRFWDKYETRRHLWCYVEYPCTKVLLFGHYELWEAYGKWKIGSCTSRKIKMCYFSQKDIFEGSPNLHFKLIYHRLFNYQASMMLKCCCLLLRDTTWEMILILSLHNLLKNYFRSKKNAYSFPAFFIILHNMWKNLYAIFSFHACQLCTT